MKPRIKISETERKARESARKKKRRELLSAEELYKVREKERERKKESYIKRDTLSAEQLAEVREKDRQKNTPERNKKKYERDKKSRDKLSEDEVKKTRERDKIANSKRKFKIKSRFDLYFSDSSSGTENSDFDESGPDTDIDSEDNNERIKSNKEFTKTDENKAYDSKMFNIAMEKSLLFYMPCFACNEEATVEEMHPREFLIGDSFLAPLRYHNTETHSSFNDTSFNNEVVHICKRCYKGLKSNPDVLKFSSKNNLDFGEIPEVLKRLNIRELRMVNNIVILIKNNVFNIFI